MTNKIIFGLVLPLLIIGTGCSQNNNNTNVQPIKIGFMSPLTGDAASLGQDALKAAQMAVAEINNDKGINGQPLELIVEDSKCLPKDASMAGSKLIYVDQVPIIIGPACSGETAVVAPIAEENKTVLLSYCSTANSISQAGDYIFRTMPSDAYQGKVAAEYIYNKLGKNKTGILYVQAEWGESVKNSFEEYYEKLGGEIVSEEGISQNTTDMRTQLTKIKENNAQAIFFPAYTAEVLVGLKQIKDLDINIPVMGADTWEDNKIHENEFAQGTMYVAPSTKMITDEWRNKLLSTGANTSLCAPRAYDSINLVADILRNVGTKPTNIKNALYQTKNFPGIQGDISFDTNGDLIGAIYDIKLIGDKSTKILN